MKISFQAFCANFYSFAIKKSGPLQVGILSSFGCWIIFSTQKISLATHYCSFVTDWTLLCHTQTVYNKKIVNSSIL